MKLAFTLVFTAIIATVGSQNMFNDQTPTYPPFGTIQSRQFDEEPMKQLVSAVFNVLSGARVAPLIAPLMVRFLVIPVVNLGKSLARGLVFTGVVTFLVSSLFPIALQSLGLMESANFISRSSSLRSLVRPVEEVVFKRIDQLTNTTFDFLHMNDDDCKLAMACKAGEFMRQEYPSFVGHLKKYGIMNLMNATALNGDKNWVLLQSMDGSISCGQDTYRCTSLRSLGSLYYNVEQHLTTLTSTTTTTPRPTTSTTTQKPPINDQSAHFYSALYKVAQSFVLNY